MKTRKHGNGLTHKQVVVFSNRLAHSGVRRGANNDFLNGWNAACRYFAHELRKELRFYETLN